MHVSTKLHPFIKMVTLVLVIMGCAEISAQSELKSVMIQAGEQSSEECQLLGKVKGSSKDNQANEDTFLYSTD